MIRETSTLLENLGQLAGSTETQKKAWEMLNEIGLPHKKSEAYKFTPIISLLEKNINWELAEDARVDQSLFYKEEGSHLVFVNGEYSEQHSIIRPDLKMEVSEVSEGKHDPFSLLNAALAGKEMKIISGTEKPVFIYHFNSIGISSPESG